MRPIVYKPNKQVIITKGLFAGQKGIVDQISRDMKSIKLVGRDWYPRDILRVIKSGRFKR